MICSSGIALAALGLFYSGNLSWCGKVYNYNNPLVVLASVFLFVAFLRIRLKSLFLNRWAASVLVAYLLQDGLIGRSFIYPYINQLFKADGFSFQLFALLLGLLVLLFLSAFVLFYFWKRLFTPVIRDAGLFLQNQMNDRSFTKKSR